MVIGIEAPCLRHQSLLEAGRIGRVKIFWRSRKSSRLTIAMRGYHSGVSRDSAEPNWALIQWLLQSRNSWKLLWMENSERWFLIFFRNFSRAGFFLQKLFWSGALILILCGARGLVLLPLSDGTSHQKKILLGVPSMVSSCQTEPFQVI